MSNYKSKTTVYEKKADGRLFPLGQVVPNIDERVRQLENFPSAVVVTKPTIDGGLNLPEGGGSIKFTVSAESLLPDSSITKFDFWLNDGEVTSQPASLNSATIIIETPEGAQEGDTFDLYVRAYDNFGSSNINSVVLTVVQVGVSTPTISGKTTEVVKGEATFTGSEFILIGGEGNHDKSDWILYKQSASSVEVWSSKDDTVNLTTVPEEINDILESSEAYILKLRYHDATMDLWSEYGSVSFTTAAIAVRTPVISGETEAFMKHKDSFTGSTFEVIGISESDHDKSDWVLVKASSPQSEIWSSKDDAVNKTTSPQSLHEVLEENTAYIIKLRYHDGHTNMWSPYGQLEFTTAEHFTNATCPYIYTQGYHFITAVAFDGVNLFAKSATGGNRIKGKFEVLINGELSDNTYGSITCNANDEVLIRAKSGQDLNTDVAFPVIRPDAAGKVNTYDPIALIKAILEPFPKMHPDEGSQLYYQEFFSRQSKLESIPDYLFSNNPRLLTLYQTFRQCPLLTELPEHILENCSELINVNSAFAQTGITEIPENLFAGCPDLQDVDEAFSTTQITSIPENLFKNNLKITKASNIFNNTQVTEVPAYLFKDLTQLTTVKNAFRGCSKLQTINEGVFENCSALTTAEECFAYAPELRSVGERVFEGCTALTTVNSLFRGCSKLNTIPVDLFTSNVSLNDVSITFLQCSELSVVVRIGSEATGTIRVNNFAYETNGIATVYVKSGSAIAEALREQESTTVNVIEEDF